MSFLLKSMQKYTEILRYQHNCIFLTLTLTHFKLRVLLVDNEQTTFTTHDLTVS